MPGDRRLLALCFVVLAMQRTEEVWPLRRGIEEIPRAMQFLVSCGGGNENSLADGGGLLNPPALFALADFHLFSVIYAALSCAAMSTFAGYSAPRVHQEFVIARLPRTGLELLPVSSSFGNNCQGCPQIGLADHPSTWVRVGFASPSRVCEKFS
jgi:hypothetical protein